MTLLAALLLAAASTRVESVSAVHLGSVPGLRLGFTGEAGAVALHQEGELVHLVFTDTLLGDGFPAGGRVAWWADRDPAPAWLGARAPWLRLVEIEASSGIVHLAFSGPPGKTPELRTEPGALVVLFRRDAGPSAAEPRPGAVMPETVPRVEELLPRLFPGRHSAAETDVPEVSPPRLEEDLELGPLRLRAAVEARYVSADTFVGPGAEPTRDEFLELTPQLGAKLPLGTGRLNLHYRPALRALASYPQINRSSHAAGFDAELPLARRLQLRLRDSFVLGTLETRVADPGGEYFSGLGRFQRNELSGGASVVLGPRTSLELSASAASLSFSEQASFFGYESRTAAAGVGFELTPRSKAVLAYVHERIPRPLERPEAEARARSARLLLSGDLLPRLSGEIAASYRSQHNPGAGEGGRRFAGLTLAGSLSHELTPAASLSLLVSRSTPPSAYEANGYYVSQGLQLSAVTPLPLSLQLRCGLGAQQNAYRALAAGAGTQRRDRLLGWYLTLRRALARRLFLAATYRGDRRRSSLDAFDARADGFVAQLEWDALGAER